MSGLQLALWLLILLGSAVAWTVHWRNHGGTQAPRWRSDVSAAVMVGSIVVGLFVLQVTGARELPWWVLVLPIVGSVAFAAALWVERGRPWS